MLLSLHGSVTANRAPWPDVIDMAGKTGFSAVDVNLLAAAQEGAERTKSRLQAAGVKAGVVNLPVEFRKDEATFEADLKRLEPVASLSIALDCPRFATWILPSAEIPAKEQRALLKKRLSAVARVIEGVHGRLGLEFVSPVHLRKRFPYEFIWRMNDMLAFARECGPNCGLLLDSWHWHHAGATVDDILRAGNAGIVHVHLNDAKAQPPEEVLDGERLMPGEGVINLNGFLQALAKIKYEGAVSVEVFGRGLKDMKPEEGAALAAKTGREAFAKAGVKI
jgi:sugar phosphate isomerase/epimerase